jgi:hypothetical protein
MVTSGVIQRGQSALYVAETTSGKLGVYTMLARDGLGGSGSLIVHRHDMTTFRMPKK